MNYEEIKTIFDEEVERMDIFMCHLCDAAPASKMDFMDGMRTMFSMFHHRLGRELKFYKEEL